MKKTTRECIRKAEVDYRATRKLNRGSDRLHDQVLFFCRQSAEKYLKAMMEELSLTIPRAHILKNLLALLQPQHLSLSRLRRGLVFLTRFAVGTRYPGESASKCEVATALRWADKVRTAARTLLGFRPRPPRHMG
jgi:HEPN domain-containing protein